MRLHHYTDAWAAIAAHGVILAKWRKRLVHLSVNDDPAGLSPALANSRYRITVELPDSDVHRWTPWARKNLQAEEFEALTRDRYVAPDGSWHVARPGEWVVVERSILEVEWLCTFDLRARRYVWCRGEQM